MKNDNKVIINFSLLSTVFFLIFLDVWFAHPYGDIAAIVILLIFSFVLGYNSPRKK